MAVSVRIESIAKDIEVFLKQDLGPQARSKVIAQFARNELHKGQEQNRRVLGYTPPHETFVDGVPGAVEERVRPDGRIVYEFELIGESLAWIDQQLQIHAPVLTGRFKRSFVFFADGAQADPDKPPPAMVYTFTNTQPYTRKIERGLSPQAPDGVFEAVAALARRKYGNIAKISYTFVTILDGERNPAIVVTVR